jgi:hypothetical protein
LGRTLRCDHVEKYKLPKEIRQKEEERLESNPEASVDIGPGHAYQDKELENEFNIQKGVKVWGGSEDDNDKEENNMRISTNQSDIEKISKKHKKDNKKFEKAKKTHKNRMESKEKKSTPKQDLNAGTFIAPPHIPPVSSNSLSSMFPPTDDGKMKMSMYVSCKFFLTYTLYSL